MSNLILPIFIWDISQYNHVQAYDKAGQILRFNGSTSSDRPDQTYKQGKKPQIFQTRKLPRTGLLRLTLAGIYVCE